MNNKIKFSTKEYLTLIGLLIIFIGAIFVIFNRLRIEFSISSFIFMFIFSGISSIIILVLVLAFGDRKK